MNKAIEQRNLKAVELLLNYGADPDFLSEGHSSTPLLVAASEPSASDAESIEGIALLLLRFGNRESRPRRAMQKDRLSNFNSCYKMFHALFLQTGLPFTAHVKLERST